MPEGRRAITLIEPAPLRQTATGQEVASGEPSEHPRYASRRDRRSFLGVEGEVTFGEWTTRFRIRMIGLEHLEENADKWLIRDERNRTFEIESVAEDTMSPRRWWLIYAISRT